MNNLRAIREMRGLTQKELADRINTTDVSVSRYESQDSRLNLPLLRQLANVLNVSVGQIVGERPLPSEVEKVRIPTGQKIRVDDTNPVPLLRWEEIEPWLGLTPSERRAKQSENIWTDQSVDENTFAIRLVDTSNAPEFNPEEVIIFKVMTPRPGDMVLAKRKGAIDCVFRKYRPLGPCSATGPVVCDLVPLNPDWPTIRLDGEHLGVIHAVMIEHRRYRKP